MDEEANQPLWMKAQKGACRPRFLRFRSSKGFITFVVCMAVFTDVFLYTLIIPILPDTLSVRAGVPHDQNQKWISILLGIYGAANLSMSLITGYFADHCSTRRLPLLTGLLTMAGSTTIYCFGTTPAILVIARALQGASAAVIRVVGLALMVDTYGASHAGAAMGWQAIAMFVGTVLGPSLGGIVYDHFGHFAVFGMAYVVLAVDVVLRFIMIEKKVARQWIFDVDLEEPSYGTMRKQRVDLKPPSLAARKSSDGRDRTSIPHQSLPTPVSFAKTKSTRMEWVKSKTPPSFLLLLRPRLLAALWATFVCAVLMTSAESVLPLYTMRIFSWTPTQNGILFLTLAVSILLDPYIGALTDRQGPRTFSIVGLSVGTAVYIGLGEITQNTTSTKILLCFLLVILGFCVGAVQTPNMVEISLVVDAEEKASPGRFGPEGVLAQAFALLNFSYGLGSLIGPVWGGFVVEGLGWKSMCISLAILNGVSAVVAFYFSGGKRDENGELDFEDFPQLEN